MFTVFRYITMHHMGAILIWRAQLLSESQTVILWSFGA
jgi:hypothetical protein